MSRAILHIGTHKTGSTFLQDSLAANRAALARHGVIYPEIGRTAGHHALVTHWQPLPPRFCTDTPAIDLWRGLARFAGGDRTVILSSEEFSRGDRRVDLAGIRALLAPFDRVEVVCFLRHQLPLLQSIQLQITRAAPRPTFPALLAGTRHTGHATGVFLNYGALHDWLLGAFAPDQIRFVDYAQARRAPGGLLGTMLRICGAPAALPETAPPDANVSPDPLAFWLARGRCPEGPVPPRLLAEARATLAEKFGPGRRSTLYTRSEYRNLTAHFAPLNAAFQARLETFQPGFTLSPPETLPEDTIWREDVAELPEKAPGERT